MQRRVFEWSPDGKFVQCLLGINGHSSLHIVLPGHLEGEGRKVPFDSSSRQANGL